jgi:hypothetical protein
MPYENAQPVEHEHQLKPGTEILFTRQRHEAQRMGLHWDYRLVVGNLAYSWATKKPMPEPGKSIVFFEQPVHDREYALSPKVIIPTGSYGAGVTYLDFVRKAKIGDNSTQKQMTIVTHDGEKYLLKHIPDTQWGEKAWLFRNLGKMGNKYLDKTVELQKEAAEKKDSNKLALTATAAGGSLVYSSTENLLGYHKVHHGTTKDIAKNIQTEGFDPKKGGTGAASLHPEMVRESAGKIHVTKNKVLAHLYGSKIMHRGHPLGKGFDNSFNGVAKDVMNSKVVSARIPHSVYEGFDSDKHHGGNSLDPKNEVHKATAATTTKKIPSTFIEGGKGSKGILNFVHKNHLKNYYGSKAGKIRGLKGLGMAAAGSALLGVAAKKFMDKKGDE